MYFIYIIESSITGKYYIGCTDNIERRLGEHNSGLSMYTKKERPWKAIYSENFSTLSEARRREKQIKSWKKRRAINLLIDRSHRLAA